MENVPVAFEDLATADLVVDRVYKGGTANNAGADPLHRLLTVANMGGFRWRRIGGQTRLLVLYTSRVEPDWPDTLDEPTGDFTYYGDNRTPGSELLEKKGNRILQHIFALSHRTPEERKLVPPIFLFEKADERRDVRFRGLLVPGSNRLTAEEELVAVWRTTQRKRFQNYRAHFTVLNEAIITRDWINDILRCDPYTSNMPKSWQRWTQARVYMPLEAPRTTTVRNRRDQLPTSEQDWEILRTVHAYFAENPTRFEHFAAELFKNSDERVTHIDVTRPTRDGGRDGIGEYRIGPVSDPIRLEFALEAKCYKPGQNSAGVKEVSRLISRIKHREFGVFVTTSYVAGQAYEEIREDQHPIAIIAGADIVALLKEQGYRTATEVLAYLDQTFPAHSTMNPETGAHAARPDLEFESGRLSITTDQVESPPEDHPQSFLFG